MRVNCVYLSPNQSCTNENISFLDPLRKVCPEICEQCPLYKASNGNSPDFLQRAGNALAAAGRVGFAALTGEQVMVSDEVKEHRLAICRRCEMLREADMVCTAEGCGCWVDGTAVTPGKARLATEDCPLKKWPPLPEKL